MFMYKQTIGLRNKIGLKKNINEEWKTQIKPRIPNPMLLPYVLTITVADKHATGKDSHLLKGEKRRLAFIQEWLSKPFLFPRSL